jgi:hypothetical protein
MQAEEWGGAYAASTQGFVAMWFADEMKAAWEEGFYIAIDSAGYAPRRSIIASISTRYVMRS